MKGDVLCVRFLTFGVYIYNICFFLCRTCTTTYVRMMRV
jgi:hypothetical protein